MSQPPPGKKCKKIQELCKGKCESMGNHLVATGTQTPLCKGSLPASCGAEGDQESG